MQQITKNLPLTLKKLSQNKWKARLWPCILFIIVNIYLFYTFSLQMKNFKTQKNRINQKIYNGIKKFLDQKLLKSFSFFDGGNPTLEQQREYHKYQKSGGERGYPK